MAIPNESSTSSFAFNSNGQIPWKKWYNINGKKSLSCFFGRGDVILLQDTLSQKNFVFLNPLYTLPETNSLPLKIGQPPKKTKIIVQPLIFSGELLVSEREKNPSSFFQSSFFEMNLLEHRVRGPKIKFPSWENHQNSRI